MVRHPYTMVNAFYLVKFIIIITSKQYPMNSKHEKRLVMISRLIIIINLVKVI